MQDGRRFVRIDPTPTRINSLTFSRDGSLLAAGKDYGRLVVWDVVSERPILVIDTGFKRVSFAAISPDDHFIAATQIGGAGIKIWRLPEGTLVNSVDTGSAWIDRLFYTLNSEHLVFSDSGTHVLDSTSGAHVADFPGERLAALSTDGSTMMTLSGSELVLRSVSDWTQQKALPKLTPYVWPVFLDTAAGLYIFGDGTDSHLFVAARVSDGKMPQDAKFADLPKGNALYETSAFAAIDPHSGLVFGHSGDQLWALDLKTGKTCFSPDLFSVGGALSADGSLLAGAFDSRTPTDNQKEAGVGIWKTAMIAKACHLH